MASSQPIDSERYRQMLVRDGERRFREWHEDFLRHQQSYRTKGKRRQTSGKTLAESANSSDSAG